MNSLANSCTYAKPIYYNVIINKFKIIYSLTLKNIFSFRELLII